MTNSDAVGWLERALADIDRLHQLSLQKKEEYKSINEAYSRMTYCMDAHYDCLLRRDRLLLIVT
ncbi:hypothetical protein D8L93_02010 [Sodalis-like symbiont of Bactericera trigonica]|nr:hypothetical protein D8L93_02010 [Sodalis-like symbiont of Bactericera trigonica]